MPESEHSSLPESEPSSLEEGCLKVSLRVWRKGAGTRDFEFGGRVPESEFGGRVPESEPWSVKQ